MLNTLIGNLLNVTRPAARESGRAWTDSKLAKYERHTTPMKNWDAAFDDSNAPEIDWSGWMPLDSHIDRFEAYSSSLPVGTLETETTNPTAQRDGSFYHVNRVAEAYLEGNTNYREGTLNNSARALMERKASRLRLVTKALDDAYLNGADRNEAKVWAHGMLIENNEDVSERTLESYMDVYESEQDQ